MPACQPNGSRAGAGCSRPGAGGQHALAFGSGMAATTAAMSLARAGEHVLITDNVYGGNFRLLREYLNRYGVVHDFVDMSESFGRRGRGPAQHAPVLA